MLVALIDADKTKYPNLALMKISAWHKQKNDKVCWYDDLWKDTYDRLYISRVFTFSNLPSHNFRDPYNYFFGGPGYRLALSNVLCDSVEHICPDYSLYNLDCSYGFLTRGCIRKCAHCIVPISEGYIRANSDIEEFLKHDKAILMDNNVLAHEHGIKQIEKIIKLGIKIDFNQGLDARLIDDTIAKLLAKVKWLSPIRLACDTKSEIKDIKKAVMLLRWHNATPMRYFVYVLVRDIEDAMERIKFIKGMNLDPFAQPYVDEKIKPTEEQKNFARWVNHRAIFKSVPWKEYKKGIKNHRGNQAASCRHTSEKHDSIDV